MLISWTRALLIAGAALTLGACAGPGHRAFMDQLSVQGTAPVLSVQGYVVRSARDEQRLRDVWQQMAELMKAKHGFISADLNPGAAKSDLWIEISKWESAADLRAAFADPKVQETAQKLPKVRMNHLFIAAGGGQALPAVNRQGTAK
jgi:quinol monooxygenase YgiN